MSIVVLRGVPTTVAVARTVAQVTQVVVRYARVVLGAEGARHTRLAEVLSSCSHTVTTVATNPAVGDEVGQRYHPARSSVDTSVASVLACGNNILFSLSIVIKA